MCLWVYPLKWRFFIGKMMINQKILVGVAYFQTHICIHTMWYKNEGWPPPYGHFNRNLSKQLGWSMEFHGILEYFRTNPCRIYHWLDLPGRIDMILHDFTMRGADFPGNLTVWQTWTENSQTSLPKWDGLCVFQLPQDPRNLNWKGKSTGDRRRPQFLFDAF